MLDRFLAAWGKVGLVQGGVGGLLVVTKLLVAGRTQHARLDLRILNDLGPLEGTLRIVFLDGVGQALDGVGIVFGVAVRG